MVIVSGETGSGKTTQVPSFVLDDAIAFNLGASTSIIVTQPRRVSAIGVATRVAAERLEDINDLNSRNLIGYAIRGERRADSKKCRMLFCTTGVVLARLGRGGDADLDNGKIFLLSSINLTEFGLVHWLQYHTSSLMRFTNVQSILISSSLS